VLLTTTTCANWLYLLIVAPLQKTLNQASNYKNKPTEGSTEKVNKMEQCVLVTNAGKQQS